MGGGGCKETSTKFGHRLRFSLTPATSAQILGIFYNMFVTDFVLFPSLMWFYLSGTYFISSLRPILFTH